MDTLLIITGQTATGKTALALELANKKNGVLISADSRQVYKDLNIGTGKYEKPQELETEGERIKLQGVQIFGVNICELTQRYSAVQFADDAREWMKIIQKQNQKPIIVGGTGYYINTLINPPQTAHIPENQILRKELAEQELTQPNKKAFVAFLQQKLNEINTEKLKKMNLSDKNNPRRLIRAIEVAMWQNRNKKHETKQEKISAKIIVLYATKKYLLEKIKQRIQTMFKNGYEEEVINLAKKHSWNKPGMQTIGYREWKPYLKGTITKEELTNAIITSHIQYAKKQLNYLKHLPNALWCAIEENNWRQKIEEYCKI